MSVGNRQGCVDERVDAETEKFQIGVWDLRDPSHLYENADVEGTRLTAGNTAPPSFVPLSGRFQRSFNAVDGQGALRALGLDELANPSCGCGPRCWRLAGR